MVWSEANVVILSRHAVRPSRGGQDERLRLDLNPWDLCMLSNVYMQKGILLSKPIEEDPTVTISRLLSSFSRTLDYFFPLAGRLTTANHHDSATISIYLDCNDQGAEFVHASAPDISLSDILAPIHIPPAINSFFPLNGLIGVDGHSSPLIAVQVTELSDGIFIGCSFNHAVADGSSVWHFFNSWSAIARTGVDRIPDPPVLHRWFLDSCPPPIHLPYRDHQEFVPRPQNLPPLAECFVHFPAESIAELKAKANAEMGTTRISSLQSLLAHVWRSVTRARGLDPEEETTYRVAVGCRSRLRPPLPGSYLGNAVIGLTAKASAAEVMGRGLGWVALKLNQEVASQSEKAAHNWVEAWTKTPFFIFPGMLNNPCDLMTGSSPRYDVFGNDFGWGRPVAVRNGHGNKMNGQVTVYQGVQQESMALEVCLPLPVLHALLEDREFMDVVVGNAGEV